MIEHLKSDLSSLDSELLYKLSLSILPDNSLFDNNEISFKLMQIAVEKDFPLAYHGLSWFYRKGKFVQQDWKKAVEYCK